MALTYTTDRSRIGNAFYDGIAVKLNTDNTWVVIVLNGGANCKYERISQSLGGVNTPFGYKISFDFKWIQTTSNDLTDILKTKDVAIDIRFYRKKLRDATVYEVLTLYCVKVNDDFDCIQGDLIEYTIKGECVLSAINSVPSAGTQGFVSATSATLP